MTDANDMWEAIKSKFGGNDESKKMQKYILKQQFESFSVSNSERLHKGYDRFQSLLSQLEIHGTGVDTLSFDDLYNNLRVFESDVKGSTASSSSTQNVAYVSSESTSNTNDVDEFDLEEMDLKWQVAMISMRLKKFYKNTGRKLQFDAREPVGFDKTKDEPKALVTIDEDGVDWTGHAKDEQENFALMAYNNSGLNTEMSAKDRSGLGYGDQIHKGVLSYENEVLESVFDSRSSDVEDNESNFTYGPKQFKTSESAANTSDFVSCESNSSVETLESVPKPAINEPKAVSKPKVWYDAPIIEEYELDSDDEYMIKPSKEQEKSSFAFVNTVKHVKTPRETANEQNICSPSPKADKRDWNGLMSKKLGLGYGFTKKACFVCGSFSHRIRDCDFYKKRMAKQVELNKQKGKGTSQGEKRPVWNNVQRLNHQNKFVPKAVLTKTVIFLVNTTRQNLSSQVAATSTTRKVNTARPIVNEIRQRNNFYKSHSPIRRPSNITTAPKANFANHKVNTVGHKIVSVIWGNRETAVKASAALKNKEIVDSECSKHMTGNKAYLVEYQDYNGGPVAFGRKLKQFNLFSVSQMCDKKNKDLFTDSECLVPAPLDNLLIPVLTKKVFTNMAKQGLHFLGHVTPLFPNMLAQAVVDEGGVPRDSLEGTDGSQGDQVLDLQKAKDAQAAEILKLKTRIKKLEKKCEPNISHHKAWLRSVSRLSKMKKLGKKESVSKQGRKNVEPGPTLDAFDDLDTDLAHGLDYMETEEVVNKGRQSNKTKELNLDVDTKVIAEDKGSGEKGGSTVSTARPEVDTARPEVHTANAPVSIACVTISTVDLEVSAVEPRTPTTSIFDDEDITMAQTLIKMNEEKAKEKGVAFKDVEDSSRLVRSITTLKPLPSIDPKDKGKGILVEEEHVKIKRKDQGIDQIERDEELANKLHEEALAEIA
ncbi:hypothetical protein Tco_0551836 [Tanacetum coccineum]